MPNEGKPSEAKGVSLGEFREYIAQRKRALIDHAATDFQGQLQTRPITTNEMALSPGVTAKIECGIEARVGVPFRFSVVVSNAGPEGVKIASVDQWCGNPTIVSAFMPAFITGPSHGPPAKLDPEDAPFITSPAFVFTSPALTTIGANIRLTNGDQIVASTPVMVRPRV